MNGRSSLQRRRSSRARGYTLMELGVVLVLTVLLVFGMVRWLVGVGYSARTGIENATDQRLALVFDELGKDLLALRHCDTNGGDARLVELTGTTMTLITDADGDGITETVTWRINAGTIQRGSAPMESDCAPGTVTEWVSWIQNADTLAITLLRNGTEDPTGTGGTCMNEYSTRCTPAPIQVEISVDELSGKRVYGS